MWENQSFDSANEAIRKQDKISQLLHCKNFEWHFLLISVKISYGAFDTHLNGNDINYWKNNIQRGAAITWSISTQILTNDST